MKIKIEFDCDNAAFDGNLLSEVRDVMERAMSHIVNNEYYSGEDDSILRDTNGNTIGKVEVIR